MSELTSTVTDTALVFEGGGMRGSYTSAVVATLLEAGIHVDWVAGISSGCTNAANYLSRDARRAAAAFTDFATDPQFGGWRTFARGEGIFNAKYIYQESGLPDAAMPYDWETFSRNPAQFRVGAFDATSGEEVYWGREDMTTLYDLMIRVQASSSMPVLMPPVRLDGHVYVDGALGPSGGIALDAALADGYEKFFFVLTQPRDYVKKPQSHQWFLRRYFRNYPAVAQALHDRTERYNETRAQILDLEKQGKAYIFAPDQMPIGNGERDLATLMFSHRAGLEQARRELPAMREFLGLSQVREGQSVGLS